jgi:hypothetical protein
MLRRLPKKSDKIFTASGRQMGIGFAQQRKKIALKLETLGSQEYTFT